MALSFVAYERQDPCRSKSAKFHAYAVEANGTMINVRFEGATAEAAIKRAFDDAERQFAKIRAERAASEERKRLAALKKPAKPVVDAEGQTFLAVQ